MRKVICLSFVFVCSCLFAAPPPNDNFINSIALSGGNGVVTGTTTDATLEAGEPRHGYSITDLSTNSVWYVWTAPATATYAFHLNTDNALCVYTGSALDNLEKLQYERSDVTISATNGVKYYIVVSSLLPLMTGEFVLSYCKTEISPWMIFPMFTNNYIEGICARNGSMAYYQTLGLLNIQQRTNCFGGKADINYLFNFFPQTGITIVDKKGEKIIDNVTPSEVGNQYFALAFDGKSLLVYNQENSKLLVYKVKKGLTLLNEQTLENVIDGVIYGSRIYAYQMRFTMPPNTERIGVSVYDKKLKKLIYSMPLENYFLQTQDIGRQNFTRFQERTYTLNITSYKKGKKLSEHNVALPITGTIAYCNDAKGGLLYWSRYKDGLDYINSALTYIDSKGKVVFSDKELADAGNKWNYADYSLKNLYVAVDNGANHKIYSYKISRKMKKTGEDEISNFSRIRSYGKNVVVYQYVGEQEGVTVYNSKLKNKWTEPVGNGYIYYLRKGVFVRETGQPEGAHTNYIFRIFNKKKTIASHTIAL